MAPPDQEGTGGAGLHKQGKQLSYSLSGFAGQTVTLTFTGTEDCSLQTSCVVDDTAVDAG